MKTNDILAQINDALGDWTVGPDAMRSRPAAEPPPEEPQPPRMWIAPVGTEIGDEGWQQLNGIGSIEIDGDVATATVTLDTEHLDNALQRAAANIRRTTDFTINPATTNPNAGQPAPLSWGEFAAAIQQAEEERVRRAAEALACLARALQRIGEQAATFQHAPEAEDCDDCTAPVEPPQRPRPPLPRRDGRPAWQTPYGPARRR
ncbi:hypothetical protein [Streptomyces sp. cg35]|uniref:hypothetical protein n=1 Tax=Streptomyces sp. cg35 TaxID=3421650 RepID=UPI003D16C8C5